MSFLYYKYSDFLKNKYKNKVYKLPINLPVTCPNRDGRISVGGCSYCAEIGAGFECLSGSVPVSEQIEKNMAYMKKRFKAEKFIAYFQNFTNTYMPFNDFKNYMKDAAEIENIVEIAISTRPDCILTKQLDYLKELKEKYKINITIELGLQSANYHTLIKINRGHTLFEYIKSCIEIKRYDFDICTHVILNLPNDNIIDTIEMAKIITALNNNHVKLHALYIIEGTKMAEEYKSGKFNMITLEEYKQRVITFLEYLSPKISIQRLIGRAPKENSLFVNWNMSWWKIRDEIEEEMKKNDRYQGRKIQYINPIEYK